MVSPEFPPPVLEHPGNAVRWFVHNLRPWLEGQKSRVVVMVGVAMDAQGCLYVSGGQATFG